MEKLLTGADSRPIHNPKVPEQLIGEAIESKVIPNGISGMALLETGFTISTVSKQFFDNNLSTEMHPLGDLMKVECAGGQLLTYLGYTVAEVSIPDADIIEENFPALFLVVPDTELSSRVPILLFTNILASIMDSFLKWHGNKFLQKASTASTPWWLGLYCMKIQEKAVSRCQGKLCLMKSAETKTVTLPENRSIMVKGFMRDGVRCNRLVMMEATQKTVLPSWTEVMHALVNYGGNAVQYVEVKICNPNKSPVVVPSRCLLCELQEVEAPGETTCNQLKAEAVATSPKSNDNFFSIFSWGGMDLTQTQTATQLLEYEDVYSCPGHWMHRCSETSN